MGSAAPVESLESLYRDHYRRVEWVVRAKGVPEGALDDLVHDVFVTAQRKFEGRDPSIPTAEWLTGIARNVAFSYRRSSVRRLRRLEALPPVDQVDRLDQEIERQDAWQALSGFLATLDDGQRDVFIRHELLGLKISEVAQSSSVPTNTLYSRLRLARKHFDRHFGRLNLDPDASTESSSSKAIAPSVPIGLAFRRVVS